MNEISFGEGAPCGVFRPLIDLYALNAEEAAWTLVALCEGEHGRLLLTGLAGLPLVVAGHALRCTFVDSPNPVVLEGVPGWLEVRSSELRMVRLGPGFVSVTGAVECEWATRGASPVRRPYRIGVALESAFRS